MLKVAKQCLYRIHLRTRKHSPTPAVSVETPVNVRVFLAAYMIVYKPEHVFEFNDMLEHNLWRAAAALLEALDAVLSHVHRTGTYVDAPKDATASFSKLLHDYLAAFRAWKVTDEAMLVTRIETAVMALAMAWGRLPADEPFDSPLRQDRDVIEPTFLVPEKRISDLPPD